MSGTLGRADRERLYAEQMGAEALARQLRAAASKCKSCGAPIRWARTTNGKAMPLDYDEHEGGNVFLMPGGGCRVGLQGERTPGGATRHYSHFATCPNAAEHRQ